MNITLNSPPRQKQPLHIKILQNKYSSFGISNSADQIIRSQRQMGEGWGLIPYSYKQTSPIFQTDKPLNPPFTPVPLTRKGCFCLTGSEIHLPSSVPCNIPRLPVLHRKPFHAPVQIRTVIPAPNRNPIMYRSPRFPSEAGFSPLHLHPRPTKSNRNRL